MADPLAEGHLGQGSKNRAATRIWPHQKEFPFGSRLFSWCLSRVVIPLWLIALDFLIQVKHDGHNATKSSVVEHQV
jgi:hypothetical protein